MDKPESRLLQEVNSSTDAPSKAVFPRLAGVLCLDFANLLAGRGRLEPADITGYSTIVGWSTHVGSIGPGDARRLAAEAEDLPAEAAQCAERARQLCHAIRRIVEARVEGRRSEPADLDLLNREWRGVLRQLRLAARGSRFAVELPPGGGSLERPLWPIVRSAVDLLVSDELERVKMCAADGCSYLFLDTTRNGSRRWCSMQLCGNRTKARRFQERHRES